ncbi:L-dopachrome tautomerase-related protein [Erwinia sp. BNK-24-b]|uniref:L-dopachrome tautomerase-related protein n=1 Tax=unclassified Erwinia TaxID=2622719 RepID=UPI0039BF519D
MNRRQFCRASLVTTGALAFSSSLVQAATNYGLSKGLGPELQQVAALPWVCNAVAVTRNNRIFVGLPRWPGSENSPSVAEVMPDGQLKPFPGGEWNSWQPGNPGTDAFVMVNTIHIFDDDTLWVVDQGDKKLGRDAQKILQFDMTGKLLRKITFDEKTLPENGTINDLRLDAGNAYFTDSGLGGLIVVNLKTGKALRKLSAHPLTLMCNDRPPIGDNGYMMQDKTGAPVKVHSDPLEISPDGQWLYFQALTGPLYRVPTRGLRDETLSDSELAQQVQYVYDTPTLVGTAMDSKGNLYMAEFLRPRITMLSPDGKLSVVIEDDRIWGPDALFITWQRELYIPCPQLGRMAFKRGPDGKDRVQKPWRIYRVPLPESFGERQKVPPVWNG